MKYLKLFEEYKVDNITEQDIINAIESNGKIKVSSVKDYPEHDKDMFVRPVDIDGDSIIIDIDGQQYSTNLRFVTKMEYFSIDESSETSVDLIIPKGHELFHGTVEDFDIKDIDTGSYDGILWTAEESAIAQTYIPVSGIETHTRTSSFLLPIKNESSRNIQRQLGIIYDYSDITFDNRGIPSNYKTPEIFKEVRDKAEIWKDKWRELMKVKKEADEEYHNFTSTTDYKNLDEKGYAKFSEKRRELLKKVAKANQDEGDYSKDWNEFADSRKQELAIINYKLKEFGYTPESTNYDNDYNWVLKTSFNQNKEEELLPADYRAKGRLLIIKPKEDLKIYDYAEGRESDLTNVDYHNIGLFRKVEEDGYDGIKITDFAQIESEGNFGHNSIGLFKSTIPKLDITSIPAEHPKDFGDNHYMKGDYDSKEYKEYKKK